MVSQLRRWAGKATPIGPNAALIGISVIVPGMLFALAAWQNHREVLGEATAQVERTTRVLHEHAVKVFETHRLIIDQINTRLRFVDWSREEDRADVHSLLAGIRADFAQVANIAVTDAAGAMRATARTYPADPSVIFADRDWFTYLASADPGALYVSRSYVGRQSGQGVYNFAARAWSADPATFAGAVAISIDRAYFEAFYRGIEPELDNVVVLIRADGAILARDPPSGMTNIMPTAPVIERFRSAPIGTFTDVSAVDGTRRIFGYRKVEPYPVYVGYGVDVSSALAPWRQNVLGYAGAAGLASLALLGVSTLAIRRSREEGEARRRWQDAAAALEAEAESRSRVEEQLRQSQKLEAIGQLTGGVAHDFNNLLTVIKSSTDLLKRPGLAEERRARYVGAISDTVDRAAKLTGQLLAFARRQALKPEVFDAAHAVTAVADMVGTLTGARIRIETHVDPRFDGAGGVPRCLVEADPSQFDTALVNMAVNARDAMNGEGRMTIAVTPAARIPAVRAHPAVAGDFVAVSLSDTGAGIAPEDVDRIFEPFFTTKGVGQGTGLGLSQVFGFAKQSGGDVTVSSAVGAGTTFTLYLPRAAGAAPAAPRPDEPAGASDGHGICVLVVEDNPEVGAFATQALAELGYSTVRAHDAQSALVELERVPFRFEAMFSDVVMPGMNGAELASEVRRRRPDLAVVLASGYSHVLAKEGTNGFDLLHKPYSIERLSQVLRSAIDERRSR